MDATKTILPAWMTDHKLSTGENLVQFCESMATRVAALESMAGSGASPVEAAGFNLRIANLEAEVDRLNTLLNATMAKQQDDEPKADPPSATPTENPAPAPTTDPIAALAAAVKASKHE